MLKNQLLGDDLGSPLLVRTRPPLDMEEEQFFLFCQMNELLRIERTADGDLIIRPMAGGIYGCRSSELSFQLAGWAELDDTGLAFGACWASSSQTARCAPRMPPGFVGNALPP